jgi:hypothetical protein
MVANNSQDYYSQHSSFFSWYALQLLLLFENAGCTICEESFELLVDKWQMVMGL